LNDKEGKKFAGRANQNCKTSDAGISLAALQRKKLKKGDHHSRSRVRGRLIGMRLRGVGSPYVLQVLISNGRGIVVSDLCFEKIIG
jgi:hypothetical protein